ncbi:hypothetical protein ACTMTI_53840 [Nonomuraea sp. H19]
MKVAVSYEPNKPLVVEELPTPAIGPRDVLVRVAASASTSAWRTQLRG